MFERDYTIIDSMRDSVRFTVEKTLVPYKNNLCCKSSFVDCHGRIMHWHDFGNLEGPGWAANAVGGAWELYEYAKWADEPEIAQKAVKVLDHVLDDGFVNHETGFVVGYRDTSKDKLCLNFLHNNDWFCAGSMAKIGFQMLLFADSLGDDPRAERLRNVATKMAEWIHVHIRPGRYGWYPRRSFPDGRPCCTNAWGGPGDPQYEISGDGMFVIQLMTGLTRRGLADWEGEIRRTIGVFMEHDGCFGSINHDTYDDEESVAFSVAFRVLRAAADLLAEPKYRDFAYDKCLASLDRYKMKENRNGVATKGLLWMEATWDTAYLWESAEAALAYCEAYEEIGREWFRDEALTILQAISKHHHGPYGFLTEGVDWNNHVGRQHHFWRVKYGDIKYTEPLLNNQHIIEPTLHLLRLCPELAH